MASRRTLELSRVVVTGLGALTPSASGANANWEAALAGQSGLAPIRSFDTSGLATTIAGEIVGFDPRVSVPGKGRNRTDRPGQFALAVVGEALNNASLLDERGTVADKDAGAAGVAMPSGGGNLHKTLEIDAKIRGGATNVGLAILPFLSDSSTFACSILYNLRGPAFHPVKACATGSIAIGLSFWEIATGRATIMVAGGTEAAITRFLMVGFGSIGALSRRNEDPRRASRPFDEERDGFVVSEGAACLVLEELSHALARGARIYAEVLGYATNMDADEWTEPSQDRQVEVIEKALRDAGVQPSEVGYVNAHATGTVIGDAIEAASIRAAFGDHWPALPVSATKSVFGHTLGAAGALASVMTVQSLSTGWIHATHNLQTVGRGCELAHVTQSERRDPRVALALSFGFGGQNVALVFARFDG